VDWVPVAQVWSQWRSLVHTVIKFWFQ